MHAEIVYFDGPRSPDIVAASTRAGRDRIEPALAADERFREEHVATLVLRQPHGAEAVVVCTRTEAGLDLVREIVMNTELMPGEDPALLTDPDRVERYVVEHMTTTSAPFEAVSS
ncbi:hypothetical protein [Nocardioides xinjiangensis]|uniref:hypothetical protein n=1 Tax=Nocardioides xinjiangensis TaxID=2817376 RepID=UPI001B313875|nr:hypothetical protein [Nocardioides sp. SYSU D00514]